ncbi:DUF4129 domain-containing protein [Streptomyces sp. JB150]|uniref:DUF4129 domain-containing protein n=1 Tax=Streptomyces sp. JB150 TaxID=2714844 RepID=UPI00140C8DDD|nr:DUF4129 domain-containing protein [Streptomyces sp. JB150]QIJ63064.1 DUF4129 domain-containing protein [Streptomyces sp. JB150]
MILTGAVLPAAPSLPRAADAAVRTWSPTRAPAVRPPHHDLSVPTSAGSDDAPPLTIPRDPAREAARRELSERVYHEDDPGLFERALNAFWDWLDKVFGAAASVTPGGAVGLLVVILVVLAALGALWWRLGTPRREPVSSSPALFDDRPRTAAEHRATADAHAAQGHWNQAVQERMRAIVRSLEERALLDPRPGRTADEAAAEAGRALPTHTDRLRAAAHAFDDVTYGGRTATPDAYRRIADLDRDLENTKPRLAGSSDHTTAHHTSQGTTG